MYAGNSNVTATGVAGDIYVKTSFGLVKADHLGGSLTVENSNGGVKASSVKGATDVRTSFAPVILSDIGGGISVSSQNGSVEVSSMVLRSGSSCNNISLKTSFGALKLILPEDASYTVTAQTSFGRIMSDLPLTLSSGTSAQSVSGQIGTGNCTLNLTDTNGNIEILKPGSKK